MTRKERKERFASHIKNDLEENLHTADQRKEFKDSIKGQWKTQTPEVYFESTAKANVRQRLLHIIEIERKQLIRAEAFINDEMDAWELDEDNPGKSHDDGIEVVNHIEKNLHGTLERKRHINHQCTAARHVVNDTLEENWGKKAARSMTETAGKVLASPVTVPLAVGKGVMKGMGKAVGFGKKD